jgi:D-beta-D-heptose 7-phosphate kinase/D-beta-D-heptose 1-phosphate adenosyltransferase
MYTYLGLFSNRSVPVIGAGNVVANLATPRLRVHVVGLTGCDEAHEQLIACMRSSGDVNCEGVIASTRRRTTKKIRIIGARQQTARIDHEDAAPCDSSDAERFLRTANEAHRLRAGNCSDLLFLPGTPA